MKVIKESIGRDYRAVRAAVDIGTRNHRGERDGGLASKWMGLGLVALILVVRTFAPLFGVPDANLPGMETLFGALSLTFGVEGFYLFRRSYDMRREDKQALMHLNRSPSSPPAAIQPPLAAPFIVRGDDVLEARADIQDIEDELIDEDPPQDDELAEQLASEKNRKREERAASRAQLRARFGGIFSRNKPSQEQPAAQDDEPEPRPSGAQPEKSDSTPDALHRPASAGVEGEAESPSGHPSAPAPSGAQPLTSIMPPLPRPSEEVVAASVMFPADDGLGDLEDDPEQMPDDEDRETGAAPGRSAMGGFNFDDDDFDTSFGRLPDDLSGGVERYNEEEIEDVEQPHHSRPRGARGPRGRAPGKPTR